MTSTPKRVENPLPRAARLDIERVLAGRQRQKAKLAMPVGLLALHRPQRMRRQADGGALDDVALTVFDDTDKGAGQRLRGCRPVIHHETDRHDEQNA